MLFGDIKGRCDITSMVIQETVIFKRCMLKYFMYSPHGVEVDCWQQRESGGRIPAPTYCIAVELLAYL